MIAALYVATQGSYYGLENVDPWDEERDARQYDGPHPVIAHPPCQRWGKMWFGSPAYVARTGIRHKKGDDGGCFKSALDAVRKWGGVLEHPANSHAWEHFGLKKPPRQGGWIDADEHGRTCCVEQGRYGHYARKPTWLYAVLPVFPDLEWGIGERNIPQWAIDKYGLNYCIKVGELAFRGGGKDNKHRIGTPLPFRDLLIGMAESCIRVKGGK